jgi:hypothetical protein
MNLVALSTPVTTAGKKLPKSSNTLMAFSVASFVTKTLAHSICQVAFLVCLLLKKIGSRDNLSTPFLWGCAKVIHRAITDLCINFPNIESYMSVVSVTLRERKGQ